MSVTSGWFCVTELAMVWKHHRLAGARRRDDQPALTLADGRDEIDTTRATKLLGGWASHPQTFVRVERRQVVEENFLARHVGRFKVDGFDLLDEREITLAFFGRANRLETVLPVRRSNLRICDGLT